MKVKQVDFTVETKIFKPKSILKKRTKRGKTLNLLEKIRKTNVLGQGDKAKKLNQCLPPSNKVLPT